MQWRSSRNGNQYKVADRLVAIVTPDPDHEDSFRLSIKVDQVFNDEVEAKQFAEALLTTLEEEGLSTASVDGFG